MDILNREPAALYVCNLMGDVLYELEAIDKSSVLLHPLLNGQWELTFTYKKRKDKADPAYDALAEGMYIAIDSIGQFKMRQPAVTITASTESKRVTAYGCDVEWEDISRTFSVNMGTTASLEYLVEYDDDETEPVVNPYKNIPYDWILLHNTLSTQLAQFKDWLVAHVGNNGLDVEPGDEDYDYVMQMLSLCSRLTMKAEPVPQNDNGGSPVADTVAVYGEDKVPYQYTSYIDKSTFDADGKLTSVTLLHSMIDRADELCTFYAKYEKQLSLLDILCDMTGGNWRVGKVYGEDQGDYSLANTKYQFDIDENLYSFMTQTLAQKAKCVVHFDILNRTINVTPVDQIGQDTGIVLDYDTLLNQLDISTDEDTLCTRLHVTGKDDLTFAQINFGEDYVTDLRYKMNARGGDGRRLYVSDALAAKYDAYCATRETKRQAYAAATRTYNELTKQIDDLINRVPADSLHEDWDSMAGEELTGLLTTYQNLRKTLVTLYTEDYGTDATPHVDGSDVYTPWVNLRDESTYIVPSWIDIADWVDDSEYAIFPRIEFIMTTMYWWDFVAYEQTIRQIKAAIAVRDATDGRAVGYKYSNINENTDPDLFECISAWETEWTLYGSRELGNKIAAYDEQMRAMVDAGAVIVDANGQPTEWQNLTPEQQTQYGNAQANYFYATYDGIYRNRNSAQAYLDDLNDEIDALKQDRDDTQTARLQLADDVQLENYFTPAEIRALHLLYRDADYSNEYILSTSIDDIVSQLEDMQELYEDALEQVSIFSRPQLKFTASVENLLALPAFEPLWTHFKLGNYLYISYRDGRYIKLRMTGYAYNPCNVHSKTLTIDFSDMIYSKSHVTDVESVLGMSSVTTSARGGGSSSGGDGAFGEAKGIDIAISNTMLSRLLSAESFSKTVGSVVNETINQRASASSAAVFQGLADGTTRVNADCVRSGRLESAATNSNTNQPISWFDLDDGTFSFADGNLTYNAQGQFFIRGSIEVTAGGRIGGWTIGEHALYRGVESEAQAWPDGNTGHFAYLGDNGISINDNFWVGSDGYLHCKNAVVQAAENSTFGPFVYNNSGGTGGISAGTVMSDGTYVQISPAGKLTCESADIAGKITAKSGAIGGWDITDNALYHGTAVFNTPNSTTYNAYFGVNGLSFGNVFSVNKNGEITSTSGRIGGWSINSDSIYTTTGTRQIYLTGGNSPLIRITGEQTTYTRPSMTGTTFYEKLTSVLNGLAGVARDVYATLTSNCAFQTTNGSNIGGFLTPIGLYVINKSSAYNEKMSLLSADGLSTSGYVYCNDLYCEQITMGNMFTYQFVEQTGVTVASGKLNDQYWRTVTDQSHSITLTKGKWLLIARVQFEKPSSDASGTRGLRLCASSSVEGASYDDSAVATAVPKASTIMTMQRMVTVSSVSQDYYLHLFHSQGSNLTVNYKVEYMQIGNSDS